MSDTKTEAVTTAEHADGDLYIVAVGASAGGLEAIQDFFDNMSAGGNLAFIIIQHLSSDYKSLLVELVGKHTKMRVLEAGHDAEVQRDCVYVIPNNKLLTISGGRLQLANKSGEKAPNTAIDTFLYALAEDQGAKAIAVILSGTGTDGTRGSNAIQQHGGMVLVQDPLTAKFDGMPNSAISAGKVDFILSPELMPEEIFSYIKEKPVRIPAEGRPDEQSLPEVLKLVEQHCGHDFTNYKNPTILRRISRRMQSLGIQKFRDYLQMLRGSSEECKVLGKEFLINVTRFFRDGPAFESLRKDVLSPMIREKEETDQIKIWVTACSTGEEAYSIAIMVNEIMREFGKQLELKIFATDIDKDNIDHAARATYSQANIGDMHPRLVDEYFIKQGSSYVIKPHIRKQIVFARHNILRDPPFIKNDLVTCRNMLIYMNPVLQRRVLSTLQFALNISGVLFLGPSEVPHNIKEHFSDINTKWKIFRKTTSQTGYSPERLDHGVLQRSPSVEVRKPAHTADASLADLHRDFSRLLTQQYNFAALYIDKAGDIREAIGNFRRYLSLPEKIANLQLLKMVEPSIATRLNAAIRKVWKEQETTAVNKIRIERDGADHYINALVAPSDKDGILMVVFSDFADPQSMQEPQTDFSHLSNADHIYVAELEEELKETRGNLQLAVESLETANEELQSSNEELLSANEELQSSNEELQSLNEELHTLNTEHQLRIKELIELNDDLDNYFRSTEIAQVFLDNEYRIRKFNPAATSMINLIESDIGRPLNHISTNIDGKHLMEDVQQVVHFSKSNEREVRMPNGKIYLMRILPFVRQDKVTDGVVITFVDVTHLKELDSIIKGVFDSAESLIMAFRPVKNDKDQVTDFEWLTLNSKARQFVNPRKSENALSTLRKDLPQLIDKVHFKKWIDVYQSGAPLTTEVQIESENGPRWFSVVITQMSIGVAVLMTDIETRKQAEDKFRENYRDLMKTKESYRSLNQELEQKVAERTRELSFSEERFRLIANATSDAIWDWDLVNNELWWSESFYQLFGFDNIETTRSNSFRIDRIHPEDRKNVQRSLNNVINGGGEEWNAHYRFQKQNGEYAIIYDKGRVLKDSSGVPYRIVGAMMDITDSERVSSELKIKELEVASLNQEFRFVTDFMPQMVWSTRPDGYHDFFNERWFAYTGLSYEETRDTGWALVVHPDDYERTWERWNHSLKTGEDYQIEYRLKRYDGVYRWFLGRAVPLKDENGKIAKWFGTCTDIADQKQVNELLEQKVRERTDELVKTNEELEKSNVELMQFASVASHDLKEPLRKIHMFSNLVKDRYLTEVPDALTYMDRVIAASARMTRLINDLLAFSRLSVENQFEFSDLGEIMSEVLSDLEVAIEEKKAKIEIQGLCKAEVMPGQIRQVFQNIISNALKFTKEGVKPVIRIQSHRIHDPSFEAAPDEHGAYCRISISDNGIGFDNQFADKIFVIFQRLNSQEKFEGTGIGLAITRKIIDRHNGLVRATSRPGQGATFTFILPLRQHAPVGVELMPN